MVSPRPSVINWEAKLHVSIPSNVSQLSFCPTSVLCLQLIRLHAQQKGCKLDALCFPGTAAPCYSLVAMCMSLDCL